MTNKEVEMLKKLYETKITQELTLGTIHRNKNGNIKKSIILGKDIRTGEYRRVQVEAKTIEECADKLAKKYRKVIEHIEEMNRSKTFGEVAREWYEVEIAHAGTSKGNKNNYRSDLKRHIIPVLDKFDITQLKKKDYQMFLNRFADKGESHVKKIRMMLLRIIRYAIENDYTPMKMITLNLPSVTPVEKKEIFREEQIKLLFRTEKEYHPAFVFVAMIATGMRPCELYNIKYQDIDFEKSTMRINKSKTVNGIRIVPLPKFIIDIIKADRQLMEEEGVETEYVFHQSTKPSAAHTSSSLNINWKTTLRTMDILNGAKVYRNEIVESSMPDKDKFSPYNLRHTYCTMLNDCNIGEYFKKRLMGHTLSDSITDSVYTH